nr:hypothetical protein BaRGS_033560 [Batillaria attramentaria]
MASEPEKKPVKGILKHTSSIDKATKREVEFDEMNILATFHPPGKDYGHMKVDEPPTPYNKFSDAEEDDEAGERRGSAGNLQAGGLDPSLLASRLAESGEEGGSQKSAHIVGGEESSEEDENETAEERAKRKAFELKRKLHYNEFAAVQLAKKLMSEEEDDDEDEGGDKKEENANQNAEGFALGRSSEPTTESMDSGNVGSEDSVMNDVNMVCESGE